MAEVAEFGFVPPQEETRILHLWTYLRWNLLSKQHHVKAL